MKAFVFCVILGMFCATCAAASPEPGLLFYLSGDKQFNADVAGGDPTPNFLRGVTIIPGGAKGSAFQCDDTQLMSYWAPGNIYAQRGTLSFFWRSRYAVGPTEFPVFRVAYADSTTWDMCWLRIDYNGHGFDAFVTDASLARTRVSITLDPFPKPTEWTHLAISWDETRGIRFYVNGKLAALKEAVAVYNTGLDQFGPHSRIISPHQVQSAYMYVRGGDMDELRTYDRMLSDDNVATLAKGNALPSLAPLPPRDLSDPRYRNEWWLRYGWNRTIDPPPYYPGDALTIRKVEIHDSYDCKRWFWKATDGIRETTWPGVYNRSRLPGRSDYFHLPDWDCYVDSGKAITFIMPEEPWNHLEIAGAAWGKMELLKADAANDGPAESILFRRPKGQEKTVHTFSAPITGQKIRFTNDEQEEPIGELTAYNVHPGREPQGTARLAFRLNANAPVPATLDDMAQFIRGRFPEDERQMMVAEPVSAAAAPAALASVKITALPLVHILIPDTWDNMTDGLDGIAIDLPALDVKPTHGQLFPLNIQVKDPDWLYRDMLDFTFSVKPGEAKTLWLDLRDRILPVNRGFYITITGAGADFGPAQLQGAQIRLIFKSREAARPEHELDRFTQIRDNFAMMSEEHPSNPRLNLYNRYIADLTELIRVNPSHMPGMYYAARSGLGQAPPSALAKAPADVPLWAFRQVELLGRYKRFVDWFIDHRQSPFGDFGGGLSDDNDLTNIFPGVAMMGSDPDKIANSLRLILEAHYKNGMFTNGINTLQTDYLHSFEEGTNCLGQNLMLDYGNPRQLERAMESARGVQGITGVNAAGDRLIKSFYFSATKVAQDEPWGWSRPDCYMMLQPTELLIQYNDNPAAIKFLSELGDGLLDHRHVNAATGRATMPSAIRFVDGAETGQGAGGAVSELFWTLWRATGSRKYLDPVLDGGQGINPYPLYPSQNAGANAPAPSDIIPVAAGARGRGGRGGGVGGAGRGGGGFPDFRLAGSGQCLHQRHRGLRLQRIPLHRWKLLDRPHVG